MGDLPLRTPTHRRIGGPSHRQLPNAPHGHPFPARRPFLPRRCLPDIYAVLDGVSADYPPGKGRFHTCYSPVRRSPAAYCYTPLPLDLHVSSLSLAFILSQDQTLRCCYLFRFPFFQICPRRHASFRCGRPLNGCLDPSCLDASPIRRGPGIDGKLISFPLSHLSCC